MTTQSAIRILIVDDHAILRFALAEAFERREGLELIGEAENGDQALELYRKFEPDVVTMDYILPGKKGNEVIAAIRDEFPEARIVLLSISETEENLWRAVEAGALGCVSKGAEIDEIVTAVRSVARGNPFYSEGLEEKLAERRARNTLSPRQVEVVGLLVKGHSNKEIEAALELSPSTVKHHLTHVFSKLGVNDRTHAATVAVQRGIVELD